MSESGIIYLCGRCRQLLRPTDEVVQTERIRLLQAVSGKPKEQTLVGEWFHERCWGQGIRPFREIDRGPLAEVLDRS
jgi:hypothetical protein